MKELQGNIYRDFETPLYKLTSDTLHDRYNNHLEYFPMVNQRVFKIGSSGSTSGADTEHGKDILNV